MALLAIELLPPVAAGGILYAGCRGTLRFLTVRLRRRKELLEAILCTGLLWILLYGCLLILAAAVPPLLLGFSPDIGLSVTAVGLKLLDVGFQFLLILSVLCVTGAGDGRSLSRWPCCIFLCAAHFANGRPPVWRG